MKKRIAVLTMALMGTAALAEQGDVHIDVMGGVNFMKNDIVFNTNGVDYRNITIDNNKGYGFHLGVGYSITDNIRVGGRYSYHKGDSTVYTATSGDPHVVSSKRYSHTLMAEATYDFVNSSKFTPYVKAGLGFSHKKHSATLGVIGGSQIAQMSANTKTDFAWRLGAGVNYQINRNFSVVAEYQYSDLGSMGRTANSIAYGDTIYTNGDSYRVSEINLGLRYSF